FTLALLTDTAYWQTGDIMWHHFSAWLLFAGMAFGVVAGLTGVVALLLRTERRGHRTWLHAIGYVVILVLAFINNLVHAGDGWTAIVPTGLVLSAATVLLMAVVAVLDGTLAVRRVGVSYHA
ncbi:hypothetical protein B7939_11890, partial [Eggerthia catenaformis]